MPFYHRLGQTPSKRHTQFRKPDGKLYAEELVSTEGFSSIYSLVYHCHPPTLVKHIGEPYSVAPKAKVEKNLQNRSFLTFKTNRKTISSKAEPSCYTTVTFTLLPLLLKKA
jgi:homogentisate 1,2-dioxygenase